MSSYFAKFPFTYTRLPSHEKIFAVSSTNRGSQCSRATIISQTVQGQPAQGTCTGDALDGLCHCNHNSKGSDTVRTQNILNQGRKQPQPLEKGCCHELWLRTGKKIVFCGCHSVIVVGKSEITQKLKKPTTTHKPTNKSTNKQNSTLIIS